MKSFKNILVVRTDRIGDVVLTSPAFKELRGAFPYAKITALVVPSTKELVEGNPNIDQVLVDDRKNDHKGILGFWRLVSILREKRFDCAIIFHTKRRANALCFLAGIPYRAGYRNNKWGFLLTDPAADRRHEGIKHESQYCLDVVRHLGVTVGSGELFLPLQKGSEEWAEHWLKEQKILLLSDKLIAIHPGASGPEKQWVKSGFAQVIQHLTDKYSAKVVLIGAPEIQPVAREIQMLAQRPVWDLTGKTTIGQLTSLLKRCKFLVSNDSGPVHVADAVGTPVISIFTRNQPGINSVRWRPLSGRGRVLSPALQKAGAPPENVPVQDVLEAVDALFKLC